MRFKEWLQFNLHPELRKCNLAPLRMPRYNNIQILVDQAEQFEKKGESELAEMTLQNLVKYIEKTKTT